MPAGVADAFSGECKLLAVRAVYVADEEIAHASVFRSGSVADSIDDVLSIRRNLRIRQSSECQKSLGAHMSVFNGDLASADITLGRDFFLFCFHHCDNSCSYSYQDSQSYENLYCSVHMSGDKCLLVQSCCLIELGSDLLSYGFRRQHLYAAAVFAEFHYQSLVRTDEDTEGH